METMTTDFLTGSDCSCGVLNLMDRHVPASSLHPGTEGQTGSAPKRFSVPENVRSDTKTSDSEATGAENTRVLLDKPEYETSETKAHHLQRQTRSEQKALFYMLCLMKVKKYTTSLKYLTSLTAKTNV